MDQHDEPDKPVLTREQNIERVRVWIIALLLSVVTLASWVVFGIEYRPIAFTALGVIAFFCIPWEKWI